MNKKILAITFAAAALFGFSSCEDYFDDVPDNATSLEDVFTNRGQSLSWLTNVYHYIPDWSNRYAGTGGGDVSILLRDSYPPFGQTITVPFSTPTFIWPT